MNGIIVYLNEVKGFGFIQCNDYEKNLFFHAKDLLHTRFDDLRKGDNVEIKEVVQSEKGLSAKGISVA